MGPLLLVRTVSEQNPRTSRRLDEEYALLSKVKIETVGVIARVVAGKGISKLLWSLALGGEARVIYVHYPSFWSARPVTASCQRSSCSP